MKRFLLILAFFTFLAADDSDCTAKSPSTGRSLYDIGDTLSIQDQNISFDVCHGDGISNAGDSFKFSDLNGDLNGGDYNIMLISMNATW